jgi:hypothetical protein
MKGRPHWRLLYETNSKGYQLSVTVLAESTRIVERFIVSAF